MPFERLSAERGAHTKDQNSGPRWRQPAIFDFVGIYSPRSMRRCKIRQVSRSSSNFRSRTGISAGWASGERRPPVRTQSAWPRGSMTMPVASVAASLPVLMHLMCWLGLSAALGGRSARAAPTNMHACLHPRVCMAMCMLVHYGSSMGMVCQSMTVASTLLPNAMHWYALLLINLPFWT